MATVEITVDVRIGPTFGIGMEVLELVAEYADLIPDWHQEERERLLAEAKRLAEFMRKSLRVHKPQHE